MRRRFEPRRRAALGACHAGNVWRRRHLEHHRRRLARRHTHLALRPHSRILQCDSVDDRRDVARQIRQANPINTTSWASVVDDRLPLNEPRRRRFDGTARFRVGAVPAGPLAAGVLRVSRAYKKLQAWFIRIGRRLGGGGRRSKSTRTGPSRPITCSPLFRITSIRLPEATSVLNPEPSWWRKTSPVSRTR